MIKAVYPEAFNLSRHLMKLPMSREKSYELVIEVPDHMKSVEREKRFHDSLVERTKLHHQVRALSSLNSVTRMLKLMNLMFSLAIFRTVRSDVENTCQ